MKSLTATLMCDLICKSSARSYFNRGQELPPRPLLLRLIQKLPRLDREQDVPASLLPPHGQISGPEIVHAIRGWLPISPMPLPRLNSDGVEMRVLRWDVCVQPVETRAVRRIPAGVLLLLFPPEASVCGRGGGEADVATCHAGLVIAVVQSHGMLSYPLLSLRRSQDSNMLRPPQPTSLLLALDGSRDFFRKTSNDQPRIVILRPHPRTALGTVARPRVVHDKANASHTPQPQFQQPMRDLRARKKMRIQLQVTQPWQQLQQSPNTPQLPIALPATGLLDRPLRLRRMKRHETNPRNPLPPPRRQRPHKRLQHRRALKSKRVARIEHRPSLLVPPATHEQHIQPLSARTQAAQMPGPDLALRRVRPRAHLHIPARGAHEGVRYGRRERAPPWIAPDVQARAGGVAVAAFDGGVRGLQVAPERAAGVDVAGLAADAGRVGCGR